jgi:small redox-active disulfide protein 2
MMTIQILGMGCPNCQKLEANAREAVSRLGLEAEIVKVDDSDAIAEMGVMMTPAIAVDGVVKKMGRVLTVDQIVELLGVV